MFFPLSLVFLKLLFYCSNAANIVRAFASGSETVSHPGARRGPQWPVVSPWPRCWFFLSFRSCLETFFALLWDPTDVAYSIIVFAFLGKSALAALSSALVFVFREKE